jgi:hypothetical protein
MTGVNTVQASRMSVNGRLSHLQGVRVSKIISEISRYLDTSN